MCRHFIVHFLSIRCTTGQHIWRPHKSSKAHSKLSTSDKDSREDIVVMATNTP